MTNETRTLFAIYKNDNHLGNEKGINVDDAIKKYLIAASYKKLLTDSEFVSQYSGKIAVQNIHY